MARTHGALGSADAGGDGAFGDWAFGGLAGRALCMPRQIRASPMISAPATIPSSGPV